MKILMLFSMLVASSYSLARDTDAFNAFVKKQKAEEHQEAKKWDTMKKACTAKYPKWTTTDHPDYDAHFKCSEAIDDTRNEFRKKQDEVACKEMDFRCNKK